MSKTDEHDRKHNDRETDGQGRRPGGVDDPELVHEHDPGEPGEADGAGDAGETGGAGGASLEQQLAELDDRYRRALADYQNFQRRAIENEQRARDYGSAEVLKALIPMLDNCQLALHMNPETVSTEQVLQGVKGIIEQFFTTLARFGVAPVEPTPGEEFDPDRHEAVMRVESDEVEPGAIVQVLQIGYELKGRVVRPAQVSVRPNDGEG